MKLIIDTDENIDLGTALLKVFAVVNQVVKEYNEKNKNFSSAYILERGLVVAARGNKESITFKVYNESTGWKRGN